MTEEQIREVPKFEAWVKHYLGLKHEGQIKHDFETTEYPTGVLTILFHTWLAAKSQTYTEEASWTGRQAANDD